MLYDSFVSTASTTCRLITGKHFVSDLSEPPTSIQTHSVGTTKEVQEASLGVGTMANFSYYLPRVKHSKIHTFLTDLSCYVKCSGYIFYWSEKAVIVIIKIPYTFPHFRMWARQRRKIFQCYSLPFSLPSFLPFVILLRNICFTHTTCQENKPLGMLLRFPSQMQVI